ncbi:MAG: hypothetical protein SFU53_03515 [Terrimicrobiaceae bacterium]|nr:hypothetical protein [Terrimicrobiaceae bacterium]
MNRPVVFQEVHGAGPRLAAAQERLRASIAAFGLDALPFPAGRSLVRFEDVLWSARRVAAGDAFVWCNSDVSLTRDPFDVPDRGRVYGFFRREVPSGEITRGVDMYYIPVKWWDDYLSKDIPKLWLGASYVDWWISRAMQKAGAYEDLIGYIDHITHPRSAASGSDRDRFYQNNFRSFNRWARRNGLDTIPAPPYLIPGIGHVWGVRDLIRRLVQKT